MISRHGLREGGREWGALWLLLAISCGPALGGEAPPPGAGLLRAFFEDELRTIRDRSPVRVGTLEAWNERRPELRRQLREMLGLWPEPPRTPLMTTVTATIDRPDLGIVVEKLHYQSRPGLYVTGNLYRPREFTGRLPAILYLCGHGRVKVGDVSYGNKAHYRHHPAWFARHGYVCLVIDTLQLGEIEGRHHGTYRYDEWWWVARGYTPAGVEAWGSIRAVDLLLSRREVDSGKIGVTGRSGGGIGSWWLGALDDRVAALVPVAGITDLRNHILDGCIEGHCDCNYPVNLYRWDYPTLAALSAPRPLLLANSDKDSIFPLDGVLRVHDALRHVYGLHDHGDRLGLLITEGPHGDTQDLRVPAFRWMERWLRGRADYLVDEPATPRMEPETLRVLETIPPDEVNTRIDRLFVPRAPAPDPPSTRAALAALCRGWMERLRAVTFRNLPPPDEPYEEGETLQVEGRTFRVRDLSLRSEGRVRLPIRCVAAAGADGGPAPRRVILEVVDEAGWARLESAVAGDLGSRLGIDPGLASAEAEAELTRRLRAFRADGATLAVFPPRGVGPTRWSTGASDANHIRRRFLAIGRTLTSTRVHDVRRAAGLLAARAELRGATVEVVARGEMAGVALYAAILEPRIRSLDLTRVPSSHHEGVCLMNVLKVLDIPQAVALVFPRRVTLRDVDPGAFSWTQQASRLFDGEGPEPLDLR